MSKTREITGTMVRGVEAPTLHELKSRACSIEELQAAIVQLIEVVNTNAIADRKDINALQRSLSGKQDKEWRATL